MEQFEGVSLIESRVFSNSDVFLRLIEFPRSRGSNLTSLRIFDEKSNAKPIDLSDSWGFEEVFFLVKEMSATESKEQRVGCVIWSG